MKPDKQLQQDVMDELRYEPSLDEKEIGINVTAGLVTLTGRVKTYAEKLAAMRAVERVEGVRGIAIEMTVVPPKAFEHTDVEIAEAAMRALAWCPTVPRDRVKVRVENGWLTLEGKLDWQYQKDVAVRAVRDLLADCLSTLPALLERANLPALHFHFANFDAPRRELFPQALDAYEHFLRCGALDRLWQVVREGKERWLASARELLALSPAAREAALQALLAPSVR